MRHGEKCGRCGNSRSWAEIGHGLVSLSGMLKVCARVLKVGIDFQSFFKTSNRHSGVADFVVSDAQVAEVGGVVRVDFDQF